MPETKKQQHISNRLIVYIILFSSMVTAMVTVIQLYSEYLEDKSLLDNNIDNINTGYHQSITNAVWLDDKQQLIAILDGVVALPDIEYIEVRVNDDLYAFRGQRVESNSLNTSFPLSYLHDNKMLTIGNTFVEASLSGIYQRLLNHAWAILGLNAIKTFVVAIFMYFMFNRLVIRRLEYLSSFVRQYDIQNANSQTELKTPTDDKHPDEITEIVTALNSMQVHLSQSLKELLNLKNTLDLSLDGVFMFHPETFRFVYANLGASKLLGYTTEELMNMTPIDISPNMTKQRFSKLISSTLASENQAINIETLFQSKQGETTPVRLLLQYLQPDNESPRFVFMARDISEHIKSEMAIRKSLDEAKTANTELESFSYSVSHDLRSPLRSIDGFSHLLLEDYGDKIDETGKNYIRRVRDNSQHMGRLIDDMLSLSSVTRGEISRQNHNISEMAKQAVKKLQDSEPERKVSITIAPAMQAWVDKSMFQNLLDNLIGNAWKYTGKTNYPAIEFGSTTQNSETVYYVRDNGVGFDMQYAGKLFGAFQRLHSAEEFAGTGIGLATVLRILRKHGGRAWAEAEVGKGATFYFTLESKRDKPEISAIS